MFVFNILNYFQKSVDRFYCSMPLIIGLVGTIAAGFKIFV